MSYSEVKYFQCDNCVYHTNNIDRITSHKCQKEDVCDNCGKLREEHGDSFQKHCDSCLKFKPK